MMFLHILLYSGAPMREGHLRMVIHQAEEIWLSCDGRLSVCLYVRTHFMIVLHHVTR